MNKPKRELLRDDYNAKIAGVCAGVADYFGWELWLVRVVCLSALLLGLGPFVPVLYIAGWIVLEKKSVVENQSHDGMPANYRVQKQPAKLKNRPIEVKTRLWQRGESAKVATRQLISQFDTLEQRLRQLERYITSNKYKLDSEFRNL